MSKQGEIEMALLSKVRSIRLWANSPNDPLSAKDDTSDILRYLDSKGVVIKDSSYEVHADGKICYPVESLIGGE
uniref:Uncharacterized protein n=1 Tax=viral metagenome TaxID=1070528 RepID=A0A6M3KXI2_9ZZZZ